MRIDWKSLDLEYISSFLAFMRGIYTDQHVGIMAMENKSCLSSHPEGSEYYILVEFVSPENVVNYPVINVCNPPHLIVLWYAT